MLFSEWCNFNCKNCYLDLTSKTLVCKYNNGNNKFVLQADIKTVLQMIKDYDISYVSLGRDPIYPNASLFFILKSNTGNSVNKYKSKDKPTYKDWYNFNCKTGIIDYKEECIFYALEDTHQFNLYDALKYFSDFYIKGMSLTESHILVFQLSKN